MIASSLARSFDRRATALPVLVPGLLRHGLTRSVEALALFSELLLGYGWVTQAAAPGLLLIAHFAIVAFYLFALRGIGAGLSGAVVFRAAMMCLLGPFAFIRLLMPATAVAARAVAGAGAGPSGAGDAPIADTSAADALYAQILADRRPRRDTSNRRTLRDAIDSDELADQQFAIAMISQRYEPEMLSALAAALRSPTPAVRVQAAAVFAKLRERSAADAQRILAAARRGESTTVASRDLSERCRRLAASGFLDDDTASELRRVADSLDTHRASGAAASAAPSVGAPALATRDRGSAVPSMPNRSWRKGAAGRARPPRSSTRGECHVG
jgi:hypothetical protein